MFNNCRNGERNEGKENSDNFIITFILIFMFIALLLPFILAFGVLPFFFVSYHLFFSFPFLFFFSPLFPSSIYFFSIDRIQQRICCYYFFFVSLQIDEFLQFNSIVFINNLILILISSLFILIFFLIF